MVKREIYNKYRTIEEFCYTNDLDQGIVSRFLYRHDRDFKFYTIVKIANALAIKIDFSTKKEKVERKKISPSLKKKSSSPLKFDHMAFSWVKTLLQMLFNIARWIMLRIDILSGIFSFSMRKK